MSSPSHAATTANPASPLNLNASPSVSRPAAAVLQIQSPPRRRPHPPRRRIQRRPHPPRRRIKPTPRHRRPAAPLRRQLSSGKPLPRRGRLHRWRLHIRRLRRLLVFSSAQRLEHLPPRAPEAARASTETPGYKYIEEVDLLRFFTKEQVGLVLPMFEGASETGKIKKVRFEELGGKGIP